MYPQIEIFGRTVGSYGLCALAGFTVCFIVAAFLSRKEKVSFEDLILLFLSVGGGMLLGGHLLFGITQTKLIIESFSLIGRIPFGKVILRIAACFGGSVFYGGFLGGLLAIFLFTRFSKFIRFHFALDLYAVLTPLFHVFGRVGCFLGGCCYGKESHWGFLIEKNPLNPSIVGVVRIPVQLLEAGCNLLIFAFLLILFFREKHRNHLIDWYLFLYPVSRFILEFYRGDEIRGHIWLFSTSQWISMTLFTVALIRFVSKGRNGKKNH